MPKRNCDGPISFPRRDWSWKYTRINSCQSMNMCIYSFLSAYKTKQEHKFSSEKQSTMWNMIKDFRSFSFCHGWKMKHLGFSWMWKIISTTGWTIEQMCFVPGKFVKVTKTREKKDMTQVVTLEIHLGGFKSSFSELNHFWQGSSVQGHQSR